MFTNEEKIVRIVLLVAILVVMLDVFVWRV